jgi:hypothetical protein
MKEFDMVKLTKNYEGIPEGTQGTIVQEYHESLFEVEFVDENYKMIDTVTTPIMVLDLVQEF